MPIAPPPSSPLLLQEAIAKAGSLEEIQRLEAQLQSGVIPGEGDKAQQGAEDQAGEE